MSERKGGRRVDQSVSVQRVVCACGWRNEEKAARLFSFFFHPHALAATVASSPASHTDRERRKSSNIRREGNAQDAGGGSTGEATRPAQPSRGHAIVTTATADATTVTAAASAAARRGRASFCRSHVSHAARFAGLSCTAITDPTHSNHSTYKRCADQRRRLRPPALSPSSPSPPPPQPAAEFVADVTDIR